MLHVPQFKEMFSLIVSSTESPDLADTSSYLLAQGPGWIFGHLVRAKSTTITPFDAILICRFLLERHNPA